MSLNQKERKRGCSTSLVHLGLNPRWPCIQKSAGCYKKGNTSLTQWEGSSFFFDCVSLQFGCIFKSLWWWSTWASIISFATSHTESSCCKPSESKFALAPYFRQWDFSIFSDLHSHSHLHPIPQPGWQHAIFFFFWEVLISLREWRIYWCIAVE